MSVTHTPGPWEIDGIGSDGSFDIWCRREEPRDEYVVCSRNPIQHRADESKANASVIVAAPDLLSIARRWAALDGGSWHIERNARDKQELLADTAAAIAKAEGRPA